MNARLQGRDWAGLAAVIVAAAVSIGWAAALVLTATPWTDTVTSEGANLLTTIGGVLAGGVASYLGGVLRDRGRESGMSDAGPTPPTPPSDDTATR